MILIPGGVFNMGASYAVKPSSDYYLHPVALRSFCLDDDEVTVAEYEQCVKSGDCTQAHSNAFSCTAELEGKHDHPINCVDWHQAVKGCEAMHKRLPTEEEWEYAARGGKEERMYSWGSLPPSSQRSCYDHPGTCPIRSFDPGAFGLHDMTGNVWEWTSSPFAKHAGWTLMGEWRVYRGGSYSRRFPKWMKTWVRNRFRPSEWGAHLGFRCAADMLGSPCPEGSEPLPNTTRCKLPGETIPAPPPTAPSVSGIPAETMPPPTITRDPQFDADCERYKPGRPIAYLIKGSSFAQRQHAKRVRGCTNRDVDASSNSVCCPQ